MRRQSVPGHLSALGEWPGGEARLEQTGETSNVVPELVEDTYLATVINSQFHRDFAFHSQL